MLQFEADNLQIKDINTNVISVLCGLKNVTK